jgi:L-alanine-DL-glutamate epimerase-like enolase superfamily enzyme
MRITRIETYAREVVTLVRVVAEDGAEGWGQTAPFNADITATVLHRQVARHALGRDEADIAGLCRDAIDKNHKFPWSYVCRALAGVETALWDLAGKRAGKLVCELLGGPSSPAPRPAYGSSMRRDITPEDEGARLRRLRDEQGYRAFKIRLGTDCGHDVDAWPGRTEALIPEVRSAVGDDVMLLADANSCYTPGRAIEVGRIMEDNGYRHYEEPCPYWELEWTAQVAAALDIPVAGGEQDNDLAQWKRMVRMHAVDIVQPDICYVGGIHRARKVAEMAEAAGMPCTPHSANRSFVTLFTMHMLAAIPNPGPFLEFSIEPVGWAAELFDPPLEAHDGAVPFPDLGPGWGVRVRPEWLAGSVRAESSVT